MHTRGGKTPQIERASKRESPSHNPLVSVRYLSILLLLLLPHPDPAPASDHFPGNQHNGGLHGRSCAGSSTPHSVHTQPHELPRSLPLCGWRSSFFFSSCLQRNITLRDVPKPVFWDVPWYLIINTAIGGGWPGPANDSTLFPVHHAVDYVHVSRLA